MPMQRGVIIIGLHIQVSAFKSESLSVSSAISTEYNIEVALSGIKERFCDESF